MLQYTGVSTSAPLVNLGTGAQFNVQPVDFSVTALNSVTGPLLALNRVAFTPVGTANRRTINVLDFGADPTGVSDSTAAFNAAFATGTNFNLTPAGLNPQPCVYAPAGFYLVTDAINMPASNSCLFGDGRTLTVLKALSTSFNLSASGVLALHGSNTGPIVRDIGIQFFQPDTSSRASFVAFPPGIYMQDAGRSTIERVRIGGGSYCIDARGNVGGAFFDKDECGALVTGLLLGGPGTYPGASKVFTITGGSYTGATATVTGSWGSGFGPTIVAVVAGASPSCLNGSWPITASSSGSVSFTVAGCSAWTSGGTVSSMGPADGVHVVDWHEWDFGFLTSGLLGIYADGTNQCMSIGRVDWGGYANIQCWQTQIVFNPDADNATGDFSSWINVVLDQGGWKQTGGKNLVENFTAIGPVAFSSVNVSGGYLDINNFTLTPGPAPSSGSVNVSGGTLIMSDGVKMTSNSSTSPTVLETGGSFTLTNTAITAGARSPTTDPIISQTGGVIVATGNWFTNAGAGATAFSVAADVAGSYVNNNFLNGFVNVVPFSTTETQYGMNSVTGSLSSTTNTNINLLAGTGFSAWFFSQVSGYSGWRLGENNTAAFSFRDASTAKEFDHARRWRRSHAWRLGDFLCHWGKRVAERRLDVCRSDQLRHVRDRNADWRPDRRQFPPSHLGLRRRRHSHSDLRCDAGARLHLRHARSDHGRGGVQPDRRAFHHLRHVHRGWNERGDNGRRRVEVHGVLRRGRWAGADAEDSWAGSLNASAPFLDSTGQFTAYDKTSDMRLGVQASLALGFDPPLECGEMARAVNGFRSCYYDCHTG